MSNADTSNLVEYSRTDEIVTLTLNRPEKLNAFSDELVVALPPPIVLHCSTNADNAGAVCLDNSECPPNSGPQAGRGTCQ